ncbi:MAG: N-acetyltransferase [Desulfobacteraceae bacterium]|nr:MAG: N-acetyltransferase [Desulfobacteraceae bacterium]
MKPFDKLNLSTKRLLLRPLTGHDAKVLFSIYSDPDVMVFWNTPPWTDMAKAEEMICKDTEALKSGSYLRLGVESKEEPKLIGTCILFSFSEQCKRAEIGYILAKEFWGKGLMNEALTALIDYAFKELALNRIEADIDPRNSASEKILRRLGFLKEGHLRERWIINNEVTDSFIFGLLKKDWVKIK